MADGSGVLHETLIRLPGYPLFLAACFRVFGVDNYSAVILVQIVDGAGRMRAVGGVCRAGCRREQRERRGAGNALAGGVVPFTASYAVAPLTETANVVRHCAGALGDGTVPRPAWMGKRADVHFCVTLRRCCGPDGALLGLALVPGLLSALRPAECGPAPCPCGGLRASRAVCALLAVLPFAVWTARNGRVFHVFEPLAPRYANNPDEPVNPGWQRWVKTWCLDFVSTYQIYWNVPDGPFDVSQLPGARVRLAASRRPRRRPWRQIMTRMDRRSRRRLMRLCALAEERIRRDPLRSYSWLPLGRMADMWLRPRVENLPIDLDWWVYAHHHVETSFSWATSALNALYLLLGAGGIVPASAIPAVDAALHVMRSALADDGGGARGALHAGVFPDAVRAGRRDDRIGGRSEPRCFDTA